MRFLQGHPLFPKSPNGRVCNERVAILLKNPVYAGYVEAPSWGISLRKGQHEGLISLQTHQRIKERIEGIDRAPRRKNLNVDFPLRGFVLCADCGTPLTACWSTGSHSKHPYYLCRKRGCTSYGKSIRRDVIEGEFEDLLQTVQPTARLFKVARAMFTDLWNLRLTHAQTELDAFKAELQKIDREIARLLERIVDADVPSVIAAYEKRVARLEEDKLVLKERLAKGGRPASTFDQTVRTALEFLGNPWNLWASGRLEDRRSVLKLTFSDRLRYSRGEGFRTANLSLPFQVLRGFAGASGGISGGDDRMARPRGFEPLTPKFVVWCSIQLSYGRKAAGR